MQFEYVIIEPSIYSVEKDRLIDSGHFVLPFVPNQGHVIFLGVTKYVVKTVWIFPNTPHLPTVVMYESKE